MAEAANLEVRGGGGSDANSVILTATSSFSSTRSSSDLDTESTTSFFRRGGITLGSLIGIARGIGATAADDTPLSRPHSTRANRATCCAGGAATLSSADSTSSSQGISCTHMSRIRDNGKLWSLLPCGHCIYANVGKGFCCAHKGDSCVVPSAIEPLSSSLGHFLVAERDAERLSSSSDAKVYINIMYEESHRAEEAAANPLYDLNSTSPNSGSSGSMTSRDSGEMPSSRLLCTHSPGMLNEDALMLPLRTDNETYVVQAARAAEETSSSPAQEVVRGCTSWLSAKQRKRPDVCELGCVSYMWTRCGY